MATARAAAAAASTLLFFFSLASCCSAFVRSFRSSVNFFSMEAIVCLSCCRDVTKLCNLANMQKSYKQLYKIIFKYTSRNTKVTIIHKAPYKNDIQTVDKNLTNLLLMFTITVSCFFFYCPETVNLFFCRWSCDKLSCACLVSEGNWLQKPISRVSLKQPQCLWQRELQSGKTDHTGLPIIQFCHTSMLPLLPRKIRKSSKTYTILIKADVSRLIAIGYMW